MAPSSPTHLHIDVETRSTVDLTKTGAYVYAEHPTTDLWCACFAFGDGPIETWRPGEPCPPAIIEHVLLGGVLYAHNAAFERIIWRYILAPRYGWPEPDIEQWRCTMVMAYAMALPGALKDAAPAAGISAVKDAAGERVMKQMARPRKVDPLTWWDDPARVQRLIDYCKIDVEVERQLAKRLRPLKESELALWHLDQRINDRGVYVDVPLCNAAKAVVAATEIKFDREMFEVTGGAVTACSNRNQLIAWVRERGLETESIAKDVVEEMLACELPADVRKALLLRQQAAKASVAKIDALLLGRNTDGRARGLLQFHAASTGRWGGRRFQPHNLVRPNEGFPIDDAIEALFGGYADLLWDDGIHVASQCLRGMVAAPPGAKISALDLSNIEGRVLAWLAGERWKCDAYRAFDAKQGPDLYKLAYGRAFNLTPEQVTKSQRQIGKVMELALGYQGGVGAFQTMAVNYKVDLPNEEVEKLRDGWRSAHPAIKQFWADMEAAAIAAIDAPGSVHRVRRVAFKKAGSFLFLRRPSGVDITYPFPEIRPKQMPWTDNAGNPVWKDSLTYFATLDPSKQKKVVDDPKNTSKWARIATYGGMLAENATQAVARDILASNMPAMESAGYSLILTVHDEIVAEVPTDFGSVTEMISIMTTLPSWAAGLPLAADGFEAARYRK